MTRLLSRISFCSAVCTFCQERDPYLSFNQPQLWVAPPAAASSAWLSNHRQG